MLNRFFFFLFYFLWLLRFPKRCIMYVIKSRTFLWNLIYFSKQQFILILYILSIIIKHILINLFLFNFFLHRRIWLCNMHLLYFFLILFYYYLFNNFFLWTRLNSIFLLLHFFLYRTWHHRRFSSSCHRATWCPSRRWHPSRSVLYGHRSAGSSVLNRSWLLLWHF